MKISTTLAFVLGRFFLADIADGYFFEQHLLITIQMPEFFWQFGKKLEEGSH